MKSGRSRKVLIIVVSVAVVICSGGFAYWHFLLRGVFAGDSSHDFGQVVLTDTRTKLNHVFKLTNTTDEEITIHSIRPDCGCTVVDAEPGVVNPHEQIELKTTLTLSREGFKKSLIHLDLGEHGRQTLKIQATGKKQSTASPD